MTGFGRAESIFEEMVVTVEIKSVNHRFREVWVHFPREWSNMDDKIKSLIHKEVHRGRVDVFVNISNVRSAGPKYKVEATLLQAALDLANSLFESGHTLSAQLSMESILSIPGMFTQVTVPILNDNIEELLQNATQGALQEMLTMRRTEGVQLSLHLQSRLKDLKRFVGQVSELYPQSVDSYRVKLRQRLEFLLNKEVPDERLALETAIAAEKTSLEEELERLSSHLLQMAELLEREGDSVGRRLDFLLQEMVREINTIGSKSNDLEISNLVLDAKHALEQMREQSQNVE